MPDDLYISRQDATPLALVLRPIEPHLHRMIWPVVRAGSTRRHASVLTAALLHLLLLAAIFTRIGSNPPPPPDPPRLQVVTLPPDIPAAQPLAPAVLAAAVPAPEPTPQALDTVPPPATQPLQTPQPPTRTELAPPLSAEPHPVTAEVPPVQPDVEANPAPATEANLPVPPAPPRTVPRVIKAAHAEPLVPTARPVAMAMTGPPLAAPAVAAVAIHPAPQASAQGEETLRGRIREAVQAALRCPAAARMMGESGKASVIFDYRDGALAGDARIGQSSGVPMLDTAALAAVRTAHYPVAPLDEANRTLSLLVWVEEACAPSQ